MKFFFIVVLIFYNHWQCQCIQSPCRSNCSINGTDNDQCWRDALTYRSSELVEQLFSFSSLSVYVESFRESHHNKLNNTIEFLNQSLEQNLVNESLAAQLNKTLFNEPIDLLLRLCQDLNTKKPKNVREFPSLSCSTTTCLSDIYNYLILFIISAVVSSLVIIICIVQFFQTRRQIVFFQTIPQTNPLPNSFSTTNANVNIPY